MRSFIRLIAALLAIFLWAGRASAGGGADDGGALKELKDAAGKDGAVSAPEKPSPKLLPVEPRIESWLKDLGDDDWTVRERATLEMLESYSPEMGEKLKARLVPGLDPEIEARLEGVLERGPSYKPARELEKKLSAKALRILPGIADLACLQDEEYLVKALNQIGNAWLPQNKYGINDDLHVIFKTITKNWSSWEPDWRRLKIETKRRLLYVAPAMYGAQDPACVPNVASLIADNDPAVRGTAMEMLAYIRPDADTEEAAVKMLKDGDPYPRKQGVYALASLKARRRLPLVVDLLQNDADDQVRLACGYFIHDTMRGDQEGVVLVLGLLKDRSPNLVGNAIWTLSDWGLARQYADLIRPLQNHRNAGIRSSAQQAMEKAEKEGGKK